PPTIFVLIPRTPTSTLFPYTTLFRSHNKPNLNLTSSQPEITVFGPGVQWDIQVSNTNSATANNVWLAKNTGSSGVTITKIERLNAAGGTPVEEITPVNGIYQLGNFTSQSRFYRITAEYTNCERDELPLAFGYSCDGYPANLASAQCIQNTTLAVIPLNAAVQLTLSSQPSAEDTHGRCQELSYQVQILNSARASITETGLRIKIPPLRGLELVSGSLEALIGSNWGPMSACNTGGHIYVPIPTSRREKLEAP